MGKKHGSHGKRTTGRKWQRIREQVLLEEPLCRPCDTAGRVTSSTQVDHIKPIADGGTDERRNLQGICIPCHEEKTARENGYTMKKPIDIDGFAVESEKTERGVVGSENDEH